MILCRLGGLLTRKSQEVLIAREKENKKKLQNFKYWKARTLKTQITKAVANQKKRVVLQVLEGNRFKKLQEQLQWTTHT